MHRVGIWLVRKPLERAGVDLLRWHALFMSMLKFEMQCPRCPYRYFLELPEKYPVETCPLCGLTDNFDKFVVIRTGLKDGHAAEEG